MSAPLLALLVVLSAPPVATPASARQRETVACPGGTEPREGDSGVFYEKWCERRDGTREGPFVRFHANGALRERGTVHGGKRRGRFTLYDENTGKKIVDGEYRDDWKVGWWQTWYPSGAKKSEGEYADDKSRGPWTYYDEKGRKKEEGEYRAGVKHGIWLEYDPSGSILRRRDFREGQER